MRLKKFSKIRLHLVLLAVIILPAASAINAQIDAEVSADSDQRWFGGSEDLEFAAELWKSMSHAGLLENSYRKTGPRVGTHPHGALLESYKDTIPVNGAEGTVVIKFSYRGFGASYETISANRAKFLEDITVMFKREEGYDTENQNWFYAKYYGDGSLDATPNGVQLAGRIAKGKPKGCIACHRKAGDFLFAF